MTEQLFDVHCHLADARYKDTGYRDVIKRAGEAGVGMILNGTGRDENNTHIRIAEENVDVWVCVGVAYEAGITSFSECRNRLRKAAVHPKVIGIGEAGLNYYPGMSKKLLNYQKDLFKMHLELALELDMPIQIHNRNADEDVYNAVSEYRPKCVLHSFSGAEDFMGKMEKPGCYFSFGGMITYKKNENLRKTVQLVQTDRLLLETDSPYLPPEPLRGTINEPVNVKIVAEAMSKIRGINYAEICRLTADNTRRLFFAR